jgi:VWFA-related protein
MIRTAARLALILCLTQAASGLGQDRPRPPVFGARTEMVLVDFVVVDKSDRVIKGLTASDFVVKEDGKVRPIASFRAFSDEPVADAGPDEVVVEPYPSATPSPAPTPGAVAVVFVDDGQMSPQEAVRLRPALKTLLETLAERNGSLVEDFPG